MPAIFRHEYRITRYKPTGHTIRIRHVPDGAWLPVELLRFGWSWVCVDDGNGPLWVVKDEEQIHPDDLMQLARLKLPAAR